MQEQPRDVERIYSTVEVVAKLRRLADALESGRSFRIQVAGERIYVPTLAEFSVEHERDDGLEEVEFQLRWSLDDDTGETDDDDLVVSQERPIRSGPFGWQGAAPPSASAWRTFAVVRTASIPGCSCMCSSTRSASW